MDFKPRVFQDLAKYLLGRKCYRLEAATDNNLGVPWAAILKYEYQIRKLAFEKVRDDRITLTNAIEMAMVDSETRSLYFTANVTLATRKRGKGKGDEPPHKYQKTQDIIKKGLKGPVKGGKGGKNKPAKGQGKGKQGYKGGLPVTGTTPDGRLICYKHNDGQECDGSCGMLHACRVVDCFDPTHIMVTHPGYDAAKGWAHKK